MPVSMLTSSGWADVLHVRELAIGVAAINRVAGLSFRSAVWLGRARTPRAIFKLARLRFFFVVGTACSG